VIGGVVAEPISDEMRRLVFALAEARDDMAGWGAYASDYFQEKWDLAGDLVKIDKILAPYREGWEIWPENSWHPTSWRSCDVCTRKATYIKIEWDQEVRRAENVWHGCDDHAYG
jgi:hypothetical protein